MKMGKSAQEIANSEIQKGLELLEKYSITKPHVIAKNKVQERVDFLKSLSAEEVEKAEYYLECSVCGGIHNYESLKKMLNK